jgi:hypothetical protein
VSRTPPVVPDLPELPTGASLDQVIEWLQNLRTQAMTREPIAKGDSLDKFVTRRELVGLNVLTLRTGGGFGVGTLAGGGSGVTGGGGSGPVDLSPPDSITSLTVTPGLTNFFVEFAAPAYTQGHGNAYTSIYAANYAGTGPLPTFGDAVEVYQVTGAATIAIIPAQTGQETHFWAGAVTVDGVRQVDGAGPTGGTNGVSATTGKIGNADLGPLIVEAANLANNAVTSVSIASNAITAGKLAANSIAVGTLAVQNGAIVNAMIGSLAVDDAKIASVAVGKLTAGSIAVGQYIQSTGFTAGSSGWRILGNGTAEFSFAMIRDTLVAAQIGAGQVTASKISVTSLDAVSATIGTLRTASSGQRTEVQDNKIRVYDSSNVCRVKIGDLS